MHIVHVSHTLNEDQLGPARLELLTRRLPPVMQSHVRKFRRWQDYQASLFGKLLLYDGLVNCFGLSPGVLEEIVLTENLKPVLPGCDLFFSIAHSGSLVACAIGNIPVGIDVERVRDIEVRDFRGNLPSVVTRKGGTQPDFFECWTMAESVLKASGEGLRHSMSEITIQQDQYLAAFRSRTWHLSPLALRDGYRGYLAAAGRAVVVTEFQPPLMVASLTHNDEKGLEQETLYGL
jgi:4'-phosphopantetheinyl transferase